MKHQVTPEEKARKDIDQLLEASGWLVQDYSDLNLGANLGVIVPEFPLASGFADYLLFVDREAVGDLEAKPLGTTLSSVEDQTKSYLYGLPVVRIIRNTNFEWFYDIIA